MFLLEFPQNLIGYGVFRVFVGIKKYPYYAYRDAFVIHVPGAWGALTLSRYIFADDAYYESDIIRHEYGHRLQSRILLVFYLPVIALPSLLWAGCFKGFRRRHSKSYYWFYTEAWADRLAGIQRK